MKRSTLALAARPFLCFALLCSAAFAAGAQPMSMGITPEKLQQRFNAAAAARKQEYRIANINIKPSTPAADMWVYQFTNRIGLFVMVNRPAGDVRSISYLASGDGTTKSGGEIIFVLSLLVRAIDPALGDESASRLTLDLMGATKIPNGVERTVNGVRYGAHFVPGTGMIVAINPPV
jgi:hypothetical protein